MRKQMEEFQKGYKKGYVDGYFDAKRLEEVEKNGIYKIAFIIFFKKVAKAISFEFRVEKKDLREVDWEKLNKEEA